MNHNPVGLELIGAGLVISAESQVASLQKEALSDNVDLQENDVIKQIKLEVPKDEAQAAALKKMFRSSWVELTEGMNFSTGYATQYLDYLIQRLPIGTKIRVTFERGQTVKNTVLQVSIDPNWNNPDRGFQNKPARLIHQTDSISEAFALGANETWKRAVGVVRFVRLALSYKIPRNAPAGPTMIFYVATSTASESTTKLLMFLTMLSANLAVINFLPIPALDGGHMFFLIWEAIAGKPVDENLQMKLTIVGVLSLLGLMLFVTYNDISTFIKIFG